MGRELYFIITENDGRDPLRSEGAIVHEQYTKAATLEHALERAKVLGSMYGRAWIVQGEILGTVEEVLRAEQEKDLGLITPEASDGAICF
jgi:hypothetical protein